MLVSKIISVGDEILIGQIVNSNASYIGEKLYSIGIPVKKIVTIGDTKEALLEELDDSILSFDVTVITGGLGPTHDDITKPVITEFFNEELVTDEKILEHVKGIFRSRNIRMPEVNFEQAKVPANCRVIFNHGGTAPGMWMEKNNKVVICLPGVPFEMKDMIDRYVLKMLQEKFVSNVNYFLKSKTLLTTGIGESHLSEMIGNVEDIIEENKLAFLPSMYGVRMRIDVKGADEKNADDKIFKIENEIRKKVGQYIFGVNDDLLEKEVGKMLEERNLTLAVAESCTGGLISSKITDISGSSKYFFGGVCTYSNNSKFYILDVKSGTLENHGAVSEETAMEMAENVRKKFNADFGLSTTGIAGPSGGTETKPVGLVWIGFSSKEKTFAKKYLFGNNRERTKLRAAYAALDLLKKNLK
ncbi:MAG: competence/damage-inducible protein A [Ignavibacteriae bacterium]|nr:competence/damage-inducible protein A [Ignavibacteriota bacterium]